MKRPDPNSFPRSQRLGAPRGIFGQSLLAAMTLAVTMTAPAADVTTAKDAFAKAISAPLPEYPLQARRLRLTGVGVAIVHVDRSTGLVSEVTMNPSTGHAILDNAALNAFGRWRFRPGTVTEVRMPVTFSMPMTINPLRRYRFSGVVRSIDRGAGSITVKGPAGADSITITERTEVTKNGQRVSLDAIGSRR